MKTLFMNVWRYPILMALQMAVACPMFSELAFAQSAAPQTTSRIAVYSASSKPKHTWSIDPTPLLTIDPDGPVEITDIIDIARLSSGDVAVASIGTNDIRIFASSGRYVRTVGRAGRGPGEFEALAQLFSSRDTLIGIDASGVAQVFAPGGRYVRTEPRPRVPTGEAALRIGYTANGRTILQTGPGNAASMPNRAALVYSKLWSQEYGKDAVLLGEYPAYHVVPWPSGRPRWAVFGARGRFVVTDSGYCAGFAETYVVACYDSKGVRVTQIERRGLPAREVTDAHKEDYFREDSLANPLPAHAAGRASTRRSTQFAPRFGLFGSMMSSGSDEFWVGPVNPGDASVRGNAIPKDKEVWSVYSRSGEWLSDISLPARFRVMEVGASFVAGVKRDPDADDRVVVYRIRR